MIVISLAKPNNLTFSLSPIYSYYYRMQSVAAPGRKDRSPQTQVLRADIIRRNNRKQFQSFVKVI